MGAFVPDPQLEDHLYDVSQSMGEEIGSFLEEEVLRELRAKVRPVTHRLERSVGFVVVEEEGVPVVYAYANDFKANWIEKGTAKMAPRPFLRPALDKVSRLLGG